MTEFELIKTYFAAQTLKRADVIHGIGDDAAIVTTPPGYELAITTDTLVNGIHFPTNTSPYDIGYKSLAVNLSDLAAMGATPTWITLALTMPAADKEWVNAFCDGFFALANKHKVQLIGGDLTRGPLTITVQAIGLVPTGKAILRSQAKPGDFIYVTGTLGDAALALTEINPDNALLARLNRPEPRITVGTQLIDIAHAAIDISDGLAADLIHILEASQVGAKINIDQLPISDTLQSSVSREKAIALALTGGDDYELCFTVPANIKLSDLDTRITHIGEIISQPGLNLFDKNGQPYHDTILGYQHF